MDIPLGVTGGVYHKYWDNLDRKDYLSASLVAHAQLMATMHVWVVHVPQS